MSEHFLEAV